MKNLLSIAEIKARYASQWVLILNPVTNNNLEVLSGQVAMHSPLREDVYQKAMDLNTKNSAILFMGSPAANTAYLL